METKGRYFVPVWVGDPTVLESKRLVDGCNLIGVPAGLFHELICKAAELSHDSGRINFDDLDAEIGELRSIARKVVSHACRMIEKEEEDLKEDENNSAD